MTFTKYNDPGAGVNPGSYAAQAQPDKVDWDIVTAGSAGTGVVSGCAVTAQGTPNMTVAVASGTVAVLSATASVTAGNVTVTAANATNPRIDLIVSSSSGVLSCTAGTAATVPCMPNIPASSVVLAEIYVPANATAITTAMIRDCRVTVPTGTSGAMALIASQVLGSAAATIDFASIPAIYNHLKVILVGRFSGAFEDTTLAITLNNDTAANYSFQFHQGTGGTTNASLGNGVAPSGMGAWNFPGANAAVGVAGILEMDIPLYAGTTFFKQIKAYGSFVDAATDGRVQAGVVEWKSTAAINRLTFAATGVTNWVAGSAAYLYGIN